MISVSCCFFITTDGMHSMLLPMQLQVYRKSFSTLNFLCCLIFLSSFMQRGSFRYPSQMSCSIDLLPSICGRRSEKSPNDSLIIGFLLCSIRVVFSVCTSQFCSLCATNSAASCCLALMPSMMWQLGASNVGLSALCGALWFCCGHSLGWGGPFASCMAQLSLNQT